MKSPIVVSFSTTLPRPTTHALAQRAALAHAGVVADDAAGAERRAAVDDGAGADHAAGAEHERRQLAALGGGGRREARHLAEHGAVLDEAAVADHGVVVDGHVGAEDHAGADLDALAEQQVVAAFGGAEHRHAPGGAGCAAWLPAGAAGPASSAVLTGRPPSRSDTSMASSTRTTFSPSRPSLQRPRAGAHAVDEVLDLDLAAARRWGCAGCGCRRSAASRTRRRTR